MGGEIEVCGYVCQLDKLLDASLHATLASVALAIAVFIKTMLIVFDDKTNRFVGLTSEGKKHIAALKRALKYSCWAWLAFLIGIVSGLTLDLGAVAALIQITQPELALHLRWLEDSVDVGIEAFAFVMGIGFLSMSVRTVFKDDFPDNIDPRGIGGGK